MNLTEAINAVEAGLVASDNSEAAKQTAQTKFDAAAAALDAAKQSDAEADAAFDASLDALIAVAQASKRGNVPTPTV